MTEQNILLLVQVIIIIISTSVSDLEATPATCQSCHPIPSNGKFNIHLVPHSHDDVGWLKTYDQYYYGTPPYDYYPLAGVQYIISSSIQALKSNPDRRYIQVETAFFWRWWKDQSNKTREDVRELINRGQLEIINGGWSMNDEATTHYQSIIDQYTLGLRFLDEELGTCARPKIGWQIDPFGHSREHASINKQLGFEALFVGRIDGRDKNRRNTYKHQELLWTSSANLDNPDLLTTMFADGYGAEGGFCFDVTCRNFQTVIDDKDSPDYNLDDLVKKFSRTMDFYRTFYVTNNVLIPMGGDFTYQAAEIYFSNLDKFIKGFQNHTSYNIFYSTPSCYIKALNDEIVAKNIKIEKKTDDFFPYASDTHSYWTGYFTSRPTSKRYERQSNNVLQAAKQLTVFSNVKGKNLDESTTQLKRALGIMQHHDAVAGTEKQAVNEDYIRMLNIGLINAEKAASTIIGDLLKKDPKSTLDLNLHTCWLANISVCDTAQKDKFLVAVQNPLGWPVTHYVRIPVDGSSYTITGPNGKEIYDVVDKIYTFEDYIKDHKILPKVLVFAARDIPALGVQLYYIEKTTAKAEQPAVLADDNTFGTATNGFTLDPTTKLLKSVTINGKTQEVTQQFYYYKGISSNTDRSSGAYAFRPDGNAIVMTNEPAKIKAIRGKLLDEVIQTVNPEVTQIIRVYKGQNDSYIEFDWLVGNIQYNIGNYGKEIVTRFKVNSLQNKGFFYTDSNGRELLRRQLNKRADYNYTNEEPISGNYYPVTSKILLRDESRNLEVAVLNDRSQGGTSLTEGTLELMVHRRLLHDDSFGLDETLNEVQYSRGIYARGSHYLTFGSTSTIAAFERALEHKVLLAPWVLLADATTQNLNSLDKTQKLLNFEFKGLTRPLPSNVHLLTLEPWKNDTLLLRLEHIFEKSEDISLSKRATADLNGLFTLFKITSIQETLLGANQLKDDYVNETKLIWNNEPHSEPRGVTNITSIPLDPMQIRTFIVHKQNL